MCPCWSSRVMLSNRAAQGSGVTKAPLWAFVFRQHRAQKCGGPRWHFCPHFTAWRASRGHTSPARMWRGATFLRTEGKGVRTTWKPFIGNCLNSFHFSFLSSKIWDSNSQLRGSCEHEWVVQSNLWHHTAWAGIPAPVLLVLPGRFSSSISCPRFLIRRIILVPIITIIWLGCTACRILVPQPGIESGPLAVKTQSPNHWTSRGFPTSVSVRIQSVI